MVVGAARMVEMEAMAVLMEAKMVQMEAEEVVVVARMEAEEVVVVVGMQGEEEEQRSEGEAGRMWRVEP